MIAYIGLGSNLGNREENITRAVEMLGQVDGVRVLRVSRFHETAPVGYTEQGNFINAAAAVETSLSPDALLDICLGIEIRLGRVRTVHWGPRTLDLDILLMDGLVVDTERLKIPHPLMHERAFVLAPLSEIAPDAVHPVMGKTVAELTKRIKS
ncbi:MAG: 2-amino-4-hydroxy-6-hydroxymethyldihydropteridine diphosphokinase [Nitrospirota bacterium]